MGHIKRLKALWDSLTSRIKSKKPSVREKENVSTTKVRIVVGALLPRLTSTLTVKVLVAIRWLRVEPIWIFRLWVKLLPVAHHVSLKTTVSSMEASFMRAIAVQLVAFRLRKHCRVQTRQAIWKLGRAQRSSPRAPTSPPCVRSKLKTTSYSVYQQFSQTSIKTCTMVWWESVIAIQLAGQLSRRLNRTVTRSLCQTQ